MKKLLNFFGLNLISAGILFSGISVSADSARVIETNSVQMRGAPDWVTRSQIERVIDKIERKLEWPIRKITAVWHLNAEEFQALHGFGPTVLAFARAKDNSVHIGPRVDEKNFEATFGHELVHVILYQKYKTAIPKWLEEGLASYLSGEKRVDYRWLRAQPKMDITTLSHPFKGSVQSQYHYQVSTAVIEMIASKCSLPDLLQLSVGKSLTTYLATYCEIKDINQSFNQYLDKKAN